MNKESQLSLAADLIPDLKSGIKQVTIRYGQRHFEDQITIAGIPVRVTSYDHYALQDIPFIDLMEDGFYTFAETIESLKRFYPALTPESMMTVVRFELI